MDEYFIKQLKNGQEFKICFMIHNAYWSYLEKLNKCYENCKIDCYGRGLSYLKMSNSDYNLKQDYDYDLIIIESLRKGIYADEFLDINQLATKISNEKQKKVTVGYSYILPDGSRKDDDITNTHVIISLFRNGEKILLKDIPYLYISQHILLDIVSKEHNDMPITISDSISIQSDEKELIKKYEY